MLFRISEELPENDGTNACAFLALKLCIELYNRKCPDLMQICNQVIWDFPSVINPYRSVEKMYDVYEANEILKIVMSSVIIDNFIEKLINFHWTVFSSEGMRELIKALDGMEKNITGIFTCGGYCFTTGKSQNILVRALTSETSTI